MTVLNLGELTTERWVPRIILIAVAVIGVALAMAPWWYPDRGGNGPARSGALASLGGSLITGIIVALALATYQEEGNWRAAVAAADTIPGFSQGSHSLKGLVFSGKQLPDAELARADLEGLLFRDAKLSGANLSEANMRHTNLIGADLRDSNMTGADLAGALLQGADLSTAAVEHAASLDGAEASPLTKWPCGFLETPVAAGLEPSAADDGNGHISRSKGQEVCERTG